MQWLSDTRGVPSSAQGRLREALPSNNAVPLLQQCAVLLVVVSAVMDVPVADVLMADAQVSAKLGDPQRVDRVVHRVAEPADAQKMMLIILSAAIPRAHETTARLASEPAKAPGATRLAHWAER